MSHAQQALWLLHRLEPTSPAYHTGAALMLQPPIDLERLQRAVARLAYRHDMLRSSYHPADGWVERWIHHDPALTVGLRPAPDLEGEPLREAARQALNLPFVLEESTFRFVLFRLSAGRSLLLMAAHHIATDAWSNWVLIRDLLELYRQETDGERADLPTTSETYQDFVQHEAQLLGSSRRAELADYWRSICSDALPGELPVDHRRTAATGHGATHRLRLTAEEVRALRAAAASCEVTMFSFLLGCFQGLVSKYGRQRSFLIGCPSSARHSPRTREVVGNFVNTLPFRADVDRRTTFGDLCLAAHRQVGDGMRAVGFPYSLVASAVNPARTGAAAPLCRMTFNLIGAPNPDPLLRLLLDPDNGERSVAHAGLTVAPMPLPQSEGQLDLAVHVQQSRDALAVEFRYDTGLFDAETIERLSNHYRQLLASAAARPDRAVARTSVES